jgi:PAS domain S-box-containing protein
MPGQLRKRLLLWALVAVCITVLGLLFLVLIPQEKTQVLASWSARLSAMADDRRDAIEHWVQAGQEDAEVIASLTTSDQLDDLLTEMIRHHEYSSVMIMDAGGVSMAGRGEPVRSDTDYRRLVGQVIGDRIPGVEFYSRDGRIAVVFAAPVFSARDSVAIGAVLLSEDPLSWLYPFLSAEPVPTMTGESNLVVAEDGRLVYLVPLVYSDAPPLTLYRPLDEPGSAPAAALKGGEDCGFYLDYRDVWVLAATRRVKGTPWGLVVKVDREEVFADSRARSRNLVTAVFGVLLAAGGLGFGLMREQRLRSERHYRELFEHNPHPMWVHDLETMRFLAVNVAAVSRYGYTQDEFLHMTLADLHPAEDMPRLLESLARNWMEPAHDTFGEWRQLRKDGTSIVVDLDAHMMAFGDRSARLVVAYDITDRVRAETALKESEKRYRSFFEDDLTGDFIADLDGTLKDCNPAFAHIFEFGSVEEAMTVPVTDLYPDPTVRERILDRLRVVKQIKYRTARPCRGEPRRHLRRAG